MKNVYFSHLKGDIVYQIFSLACSIYTALQRDKKVLVVDSVLFDLDALSTSLEKKGLRVLEKNGLEYKKIAVFYGQGDNVLDLTENIPSVLKVEHNLNLIQGDPVPNVSKELFVGYSLNGIEYTETHGESRECDIITDINDVKYVSDFFCLDKTNVTLYDEILKSIRIKGPISIKENGHVIHLLSKGDIEQCAIQIMKPKEELYEIFTKKYIEIMSIFILPTDTVYLVQTEENLGVTSFLQEKGIAYKELNITDPKTFTEVSGSKGIFVGLFNMDKLVGSYCSYYLHTVLTGTQSILIDLDHIYEN